MESQQRRSTLRSNRKPLSDCTNILPTPTRRKYPNSQTLIKPPKPIDSSANSSVNNKLPNPPPHPPPPLTCSSPKSHTSTGSNNSPNSVSIPSIPRSPEPSAPPTPLSDSGGKDGQKSELSGGKHDATRRKDKGKMVADAPIIQLSASITSNSLRISSSEAPDYCSRSGIQSIQSQNLHAQTIKDKGKTVVDAPVIESPASWKSKYMHSTSPFTSDDSLSETSAVHRQTLLVETRKDKGKRVIETPNIEASEPSTPHVPLAAVAASGTCERPVTVYNQRRAGRGRKHAIVKSTAPLTCPPDRRKTKKGLELDYDQDGIDSGSHTDPLPMNKKKRSRKIDDGLLKEEVETLRAKYAEIDADKLLEEEVSEDDLE